MAFPQGLAEFMDDLSEDWISQPRQSSSAPSSPSPRRSASSKRKSILSERSQNSTNILANSVSRPKRKSLQHRSLSDASSVGTGSVGQYDTTARKSVSVSPPKSRLTGGSDEPEWRRRLLGGKGQTSEMKDMFSPMALEGMFQKPATMRGTFRSTETKKERPKGLSFLKSFAQKELPNLPSSPPPWPDQMSAPASIPAPPPWTMPKAPSRFGTVNTHELSQLAEEEEEEEEEEEQGEESQEQIHQQDDRDKLAGSVIREQKSNNSRLPLSKTMRSASSGGTLPPSRKVSFGSVRLEPASRKASDSQSWNITEGSDGFSPVFISKHNTVDGGIAYAALDISKSELEERLQKLKSSSQLGRSRSASQSTKYTAGTGDESSIARLESEALPEDLPVGTPDVGEPTFATLPDHIERRRGGYSEIGSFKRRPLSPSPLKRPMSETEDESSLPQRHIADLDYSGIPPAVPTPPAASAPKTPQTDRVGDMLSPQRVKSSNSPLKLFENHDTYTSNRLQRRLSQIEEPDVEGVAEKSAPPSRRATGDLSAIGEASYVERSGQRQRQSSIQHHFGRGDYDSYAFEEQQYSDDLQREQGVPSRSVSPDLLPPGYQQPFRFHVEAPPSDFADTFKGKRKPSSANGQLSVAKRSDRSRPALSLLTETRMSSHPSQLSQVSEGKRPLTPSPFKSPTPKRRRTVVRHEHHEFAEHADAEALDARTMGTQDSHACMQSALSRKRKDARPGNKHVVADADVLAQRAILRPRNPTPSQRRREEAQRALSGRPGSPHLEAIKEQLAQPPLPGETAESVQMRRLATHLAVIGEDVAQRKKSVTTQDFLDDAMKVMHFIRTQYRPNSNLTSLNEGTSTQVHVEDEQEDETVPDFSDIPNDWTLERPPSREGRPRSAWRTGRDDAVNPRVVSHLRKFQEAEDDPFLTASSRSTRPIAQREERQERIDVVTSDPPGIELRGQSATVHRQTPSRSPSERAINSNGSNATAGSKVSHSSRTSMDSTMGRTTNSRKSENVATLAPDAVAHLIPEQVAGMTYDRDLGRWVKSKSPKKTSTTLEPGRTAVNEHSGMTGSDNDPFGDIPDLTVDSMEETKHLLLSRSAGRKPIGNGVGPEGPSALFDEWGEQPTSRDKEMMERGEGSSADVDGPAMTLGSPMKQLNPTNANAAHVRRSPSPAPVPEVEIEHPTADEESEVEHEISILDGRASPLPPKQARNITVQLSSPVWQRARNGLSPVLESPAVSVRDYGRKQQHTASAFKNREHRELSLSVRVSGAVTSIKNHDLERVTGSSPLKSDVTFYLSELPDFTVNQIDERDLPSRALSKHNTVGPNFKGTEDRYANGNHLLVKALQDTESDEPYWEDLRHLDLHSKGLTSLHLLNVLCDRLEKLDIHHNAIDVLEGAPHTVRSLNASHNMLNGMTSWTHLFNLQYLDVSYNRLDSLQGLGGLVHLREVRADGNEISSLEGIEDLDGLLSLSLRGNKLESIDFAGCDVPRLQALDLGGNGLVKVHGLESLPALRELRLDSNKLEALPQSNQQCSGLRVLDLSSNTLTSVDFVATFAPRLTNLNLDKNNITNTEGINKLKNLESLTLRSQTSECDLTAILQAPLAQLHHLALSHNHINTLALPQDWFGLRSLELASCGLQTLPLDFGLMVPNLRSLNLNFNAIKDLTPLLNIKALKELHVAGNRLSRLRKTTAVLSKLRNLQVLDLRDNPFTLGFHPRATESRLVTTLTHLPEDEAATMVEIKQEDEMQHTIPSLDKETDASYVMRLDEGTKLRRRVYEMLIAEGCCELDHLDGLHFSRRDVGVRDEIWERLVELGILKKSV